MVRGLDEIIAELEGKTTVQKEAHLSRLIGTELEIEGIVVDVFRDHLDLFQQRHPRVWIHSLSVDSLRFASQLLSYSRGDCVRIDVRLLTAVPISPTTYAVTLEAVAINRLSTANEREEARRRAERLAAESQRLVRRGTRIRELVISGFLYGPLSFSIIVGFAGCFSCFARDRGLDTELTSFNLISGVTYGALVGLVIGPIIGYLLGSHED